LDGFQVHVESGAETIKTTMRVVYGNCERFRFWWWQQGKRKKRDQVLEVMDYVYVYVYGAPAVAITSKIPELVASSVTEAKTYYLLAATKYFHFRKGYMSQLNLHGDTSNNTHEIEHGDHKGAIDLDNKTWNLNFAIFPCAKQGNEMMWWSSG
jgi:hypothetical protein